MIRPGFSYPAILAGAIFAILAFGQMGLESEAQALEEDAAEKVMRVERVLLETSREPASLDECQRAAPRRRRPDGAISLQNRSNEPWHHRFCYWVNQQTRGQP